jgi:RNA polymerase sigma-70 factor (ECF subfamily)
MAASARNPNPGSVAKILSDDEVAELRRRVVDAVSRVCPGWLAGQAEDIAHNALIQLLGSLSRHGGNRTFSSIYLRKAAHGATVDEIRRRVRRRESALETSAGVEQTRSGQPDPERAGAGREIGKAIVDCLGTLIVPRRLAVTVVLRGGTVPEAARRLGWTLKRTEHLVYRGLADLRQCLSGKGWTP